MQEKKRGKKGKWQSECAPLWHWGFKALELDSNPVASVH